MIFELDNVNLDQFGDKKLVIFDYYDGIKGEYSTEYKEDGLILFWHDTEKNAEVWFVIKTDTHLISNFLENKIPMLDIFLNDKSQLYLYKRPFNHYETMKLIKPLNKNELKNYELPEKDSYLGYNFINAYKNHQTNKTYVANSS